MEFDKSRVYTALNADELKVGAKVVCANSIKALKQKVAENATTEIKEIKEDCYENRFSAYLDDELFNYALAYLVEEPQPLKWTDLKVGDVIRKKVADGYKTAMIVIIDTYSCSLHIYAGETWLGDEDLAEWEKVEK